MRWQAVVLHAAQVCSGQWCARRSMCLHGALLNHTHCTRPVGVFTNLQSNKWVPTPIVTSVYCWAEAPITFARMTLTIKLDRNWTSFQLADSVPPLSVTDSAIAPSARIVRNRTRCTFLKAVHVARVFEHKYMNQQQKHSVCVAPWVCLCLCL